MKECVIESYRGFKISPVKTANPGIPIYLSGREIMSLLKKNGVSVYEIIGDKKILLTSENYLSDNAAEADLGEPKSDADEDDGKVEDPKAPEAEDPKDENPTPDTDGKVEDPKAPEAEDPTPEAEGAEEEAGTDDNAEDATQSDAKAVSASNATAAAKSNKKKK
jgi:hypothetical protein